MKKILSIVLAATVAGSMLAACSSESSTTTTTTTTDTDTATTTTDTADTTTTGGFKVASHNAVIEGNSYRAVYENQMSDAVDVAKAAGVISEYNSFVANNDPALESQQIEQTINEGYDIIMVNPIAASGLDAVIAKAIDAGITYVNADCVYDSDDILNVVVDQAAWAEIQADFVVDTLGEGGKVVVFNAIDGNSASDIRAAQWVETLTAGGLEIVKTVAHGWSDVESKQLTNELISSGLEYDGIINQESAAGILDAFEESSAAYPGCITSSEEVSWIRRIAEVNADGLVLPFIVVENPPGIGATALNVALNIRQGGELDTSLLVDGNAIYYTPQWVMTYDNMAQSLEDVSDLEDSTSVSSFMTMEQAQAAYFK